MSRSFFFSVAGIACICLFVVGCATTKSDPGEALTEAKSPAWSLKETHDGMIVSVSPVRRSVQIAGASATLLGAGVDAIVNAKHRRAIEEALGDYDPGEYFDAKLSERLGLELGSNLVQVEPFSVSGDYQNRRDVELARYGVLSKEGYTSILDLKISYGVFGRDGILVAKIDGSLRELPKGSKIWDEAIVVSPEPILAGEKLSDPTKRMGPSLSAPRFTVEDDATSKWTQDGGKIIRERFEASANSAVSALLCSIGLVEESDGEYYLGKLAMNRKKFENAHAYFEKALEIQPDLSDAKNGMSVNYAHRKEIDQAIATALEITKSDPEYGAAWFNLAWWYAMEKHDKKAADFYSRALELGIAENKKLQGAIEKL